MKRLLFLVFTLSLVQAVLADTQKLSQAYEQQLIEKVKSVFSRETKEQIERPTCATSIFLEIRANWDRLSNATKKILEPYAERPTYSYPEQSYDTPNEHFKIHYVTEGDNAVYQPLVDENFNGHPDWVETTGDILEHVWDVEKNKFGYREPPSDNWYTDPYDNGGDGKYDIYLLNLPNRWLGYTNGELYVNGQFGPATSYVVLDNDYLGFGSQHTQPEWLQVTAAHEFFHAIQMGYDGAEYELNSEDVNSYWFEMSAVWMEEMVYDNVNDYRSYLKSFFEYPEWSLKTFGSSGYAAEHPYGSCVWPMFLQERFEDTTIIRDIWEKCGEVPGNNAIDYPGGKSATDIVLESRGSTFEEAFREFTVWNYFTGERARTELYYSEGDSFPQVKVENLHYHTAYPVFSPSGPNHPENLGSNYVVFVPDPQLQQGGLNIEFSGYSGDYNLSAIGYKSYPHIPKVTEFIGVEKIYDWSSYDEVIMIPAVVSRNPNDYYMYEYQADYDSSLIDEPTQRHQDRILQNYPNPFVIDTETNRTFFPFVLSSTTRIRIDIFTLGGEKVKTVIPKRDLILSSGEYTEEPVLGELRLFWDGTNEKGEFVSSGIYTYVFRTERATEVKKMAVIR